MCQSLILEYASHVWHSSLTTAVWCSRIGAETHYMQLRIIYTDVTIKVLWLGKKEMPMEQFSQAAHYFTIYFCDNDTISRLTTQNHTIRVHTKKFTQSFIPYCLNYYTYKYYTKLCRRLVWHLIFFCIWCLATMWCLCANPAFYAAETK